MKVYKDKQFLVFDFEDGKTVKYDFATKTAIGKKGKPVRDLKTQLKGFSMNELIDCCEDKQYGKFLRFVMNEYSRNNYDIWNIGTILSKVPRYSNFEQLFSAGIDDIVDGNFTYTINEIPKGVIKLCRDKEITLSNNFLKYYKNNPDAYLLAYKLEYISLTDKDVYNILTREIYLGYNVDWDDRYQSVFNVLINDYGYTAKALMNYIDYIKTYEAIEDVRDFLRELFDYVKMMKEISNKFDKYPRHFLTTHKIASRNYARLKQKFDEEKFKNRIDKSLERTFGEYRFYYPDSTQDIRDEAVAMSNCVASYIQRVIDGDCHIMFLRLKEKSDKSLVTIELRKDNDGVYQVVQAKRRYNHDVSREEQEIIQKYNNWLKNKSKTNESEDLAYVS